MSKTNKLTQKAGLHFNVNKTKGAILGLYRSKSNIEDDEEYKKTEKPLIRKSQIAITSVLEHVCLAMLKLCEKEARKEGDVKIVHPKTIKRAIRGNNEMNELFMLPLSKFDKSQNYDTISVVCTSTKKPGKYVDSFLKEKLEGVSLSKHANAMLRYLLCCLFDRLAMASYAVKEHSGNKSVSDREVETATKILLSGTLCKNTLQNISECIKKAGDADEEDAEEAEAEAEDDEEEEEVVETKPKKTAKASAKPPQKKAMKV